VVFGIGWRWQLVQDRHKAYGRQQRFAVDQVALGPAVLGAPQLRMVVQVGLVLELLLVVLADAVDTG